LEAVVFVGLQASGKSSFFQEQFFSTHVRISLDLLKTRSRERRFVETCLATRQRFVVDNTNPTCEERVRYVAAARAAGYSTVAYYFLPDVEKCLQRNRLRTDSERVPDIAIYATAKKLQKPTLDDGFNQLFSVRLADGQFVVEEWQDEVRRPRPEDAGL